MPLLNFPNPSRAYDESNRGVCFWGYDRTFEIAFFIECDALTKMEPGSSTDESGSLGTFDLHRDRILAVADVVYSRRRKDSYVFAYDLTVSDF